MTCAASLDVLPTYGLYMYWTPVEQTSGVVCTSSRIVVASLAATGFTQTFWCSCESLMFDHAFLFVFIFEYLQ